VKKYKFTEEFMSQADAQEKIERWRVDYNRFWPHSSLGDRSTRGVQGSPAAGRVIPV
jgi:transposase InsO family protein